MTEIYYWTEKAEAKAKELGFNDRKAGEVAYFGHEPLHGGMIAQAWKQKGYIVKGD